MGAAALTTSFGDPISVLEVPTLTGERSHYRRRGWVNRGHSHPPPPAFQR
jgi:hypothetical protein